MGGGNIYIRVLWHHMKMLESTGKYLDLERRTVQSCKHLFKLNKGKYKKTLNYKSLVNHRKKNIYNSLKKMKN